MARKVVVMKTSHILKITEAFFMKLEYIIQKTFTDIWYKEHVSRTTEIVLKIDLNLDKVAATVHLHK